MNLLDSGSTRAFFADARTLLNSYVKAGKFVFVLKDDSSIDQFDGCLLNCGLLMYQQGLGACEAARDIARKQVKVVTNSEIAERASCKENRNVALKGLLEKNSAWVLASIQFHKTLANFDVFVDFVCTCYVNGTKAFVKQDA